MDENQETFDCGAKNGPLPDCAPLAATIVPRQVRAEPKYKTEKSLYRGTLFPGLDLPLGNVVNKNAPDVPEQELMALDFAAHDLSLYLDAHPDDQEAFDVYKDLLALAKAGKERYTRRYGPICKTDLQQSDKYVWLKGPWPWEYTGKAEN